MFNNSFDLEQVFNEEIQTFIRKNLTFEKVDHTGTKWNFELNSYTMKDYLYYQFYLEEMKNINEEEFIDEIFLKPLLYITKIFKNDEEIDDWNEQTFLNKLRFLKTIPGEIFVGTQKNFSKDDYLLTFIQNNFDEERINEFVSNIEVQCTNCGEKYNHVYSFEDLFYVLGYAEDNRQIYSNILETESYLSYYHWFSIDQINNMSYLDFTIYSERIFALYEAEQKQKEEEMKNQEAQMQSIEIVTE